MNILNSIIAVGFVLLYLYIATNLMEGCFDQLRDEVKCKHGSLFKACLFHFICPLLGVLVPLILYVMFKLVLQVSV